MDYAIVERSGMKQRRPIYRTVCALLLCAGLSYADVKTFDVVVVGGTPGGIAASVAAARLGRSVALVEYYDHLGGMSASGLGKSDITVADAIGGLWDEFVGRILANYTDKYGADSEQVKACRGGYFYEPSVAETVFNQMIAEQRTITVLTGHRLDEVVRAQRRVSAARVRGRDSGKVLELRASVFIDATYEGDLSAFAGVPYRLGREGRSEFNEAHAGVIYMDHKTRALLPGTSGEGDDRLPAYTYRLCLSSDPNNRVLPELPPDYDRTRYLNYLLDLKLGRIDSAVMALSIAPIPNQKYDVNMKPWPLGFPFAEENEGYPEGTWETRDAIMSHIRNITLGLLYFLQNDPEVPPSDREQARQYGLAKDEFTDNNHFPFQFYVREARRIIGEYTLTERDLTYAPESFRAPVHADAVSAGEFPIDAFPTRKYEKGHESALEGYILMLTQYTKPYQIPYRVMIPQGVDGLIVPVPVSATHIAFSSVRLEPTWMSLGQAAGVAAHLALTRGVELRDVPINELQRVLASQGQVLTYFDDVAKDDPRFEALQFFGTKGFFEDYSARPDDPLEAREAHRWAGIARSIVDRRYVPKRRAGDKPISRTDFARLARGLAAAVNVDEERVRIGTDGETITRGEACVIFYGLLGEAGASVR